MKVERYLPDNIYKGLQAANNPNALNPFLTDSQIPFKLEVSENTVTKTIDNGLLYNFYAVNTGKLAPTGWKVPTKTEFETLIAYLGGDTVAGGLLKTKGTVLADGGWSEPNIGAVDSLNMSILPSGDRYIDGFEYIGFLAGLWTQTSMDVSNAYQFALSFDVSDCIIASNSKVAGFSVRCLKVTPTAEELLLADGEYATDVTDADGNTYKTIKIGTQVWMGENLKTTQYNDLTPITNVTDNAAWLTLTTEAYCSYDNAAIQTYNYLQTGVVKPSTDRLIDSEYIYTDIDKLADVKFSSTNLNDYTKSGNYALDGVYTNAPFNSPNLSGILKISLRNINGSTQIVQSYIHTNITDTNEVGKTWTRVKGASWTAWKMQLTEDELSTGANLCRTYYVSDTEESDTWETGKINFKTIGGFLAQLDTNVLRYTTVTGDIQNGTTITNVSNVSGIVKGQKISHQNIPIDAVVTDITGTTITMSETMTASAGSTLKVWTPINIIVSGFHIVNENMYKNGITWIGNNCTIFFDSIKLFNIDVVPEINTILFDKQINFVGIGSYSNPYVVFFNNFGTTITNMVLEYNANSIFTLGTFATNYAIYINFQFMYNCSNICEINYIKSVNGFTMYYNGGYYSKTSKILGFEHIGKLGGAYFINSFNTTYDVYITFCPNNINVLTAINIDGTIKSRFNGDINIQSHDYTANTIIEGEIFNSSMSLSSISAISNIIINSTMLNVVINTTNNNLIFNGIMSNTIINVNSNSNAYFQGKINNTLTPCTINVNSLGTVYLDKNIKDGYLHVNTYSNSKLIICDTCKLSVLDWGCIKFHGGEIINYGIINISSNIDGDSILINGATFINIGLINFNNSVKPLNEQSYITGQAGTFINKGILSNNTNTGANIGNFIKKENFIFQMEYGKVIQPTGYNFFKTDGTTGGRTINIIHGCANTNIGTNNFMIDVDGNAMIDAIGGTLIQNTLIK